MASLNINLTLQAPIIVLFYTIFCLLDWDEVDCSPPLPSRLSALKSRKLLENNFIVEEYCSFMLLIKHFISITLSSTHWLLSRQILSVHRGFIIPPPPAVFLSILSSNLAFTLHVPSIFTSIHIFLEL